MFCCFNLGFSKADRSTRLHIEQILGIKKHLLHSSKPQVNNNSTLLGNTLISLFNQVVQGDVSSLIPSAQSQQRHLPKAEVMNHVCVFAILLSFMSSSCKKHLCYCQAIFFSLVRQFLSLYHVVDILLLYCYFIVVISLQPLERLE